MNKDLNIQWQKEFELYLDYKPAFVFEGEILDKQPILTEDGDYLLYPLNHYVYHIFKQKGYESVVFFNHVDGFYNNISKEDVELFKKVIKKVDKIEADKTLELTRKGRNSKFGDATEKIRKVMGNTETPVAIVLDMASRYITSATTLQQDEQYFYSELFLAIQNTKKARSENNTLYNCLILIADKINDIPTWFYLNNPFIKPVYITTPNKNLRDRFFDESIELFYGNESYLELNEDEQEAIKRKFVDLTDGLKNVELTSLRDLMRNEKIDLTHIEEGITLFKHGIKENPWSDPELKRRLSTLEEDLKKYVKGQDHAIKHVSDIVIRSVYGLSGVQHSSHQSKPKGVMFFAGPTGTGKTELAKALTRWLFGTEDAFIRFDMSEYSQSHSDQRLLGAPPGYIGYEAGGQLTNAVKAKPFSILLFDEIEKADKTILDKFLQILEDGRMTDSKGETIYFSNTLIIFTSNLGVSKLNQMTGERIPIISYNDDNSNYEVYKQKVMSGVDDYFINEAGRPEIKNRIGDNFIIFEYIGKEVGHLIAESQLKKIADNLKKENKLNLVLTDEAKKDLYQTIYAQLHQGGRGVGNAIEKNLINPLARVISAVELKDEITITITNIEFSNYQSVLKYEVS